MELPKRKNNRLKGYDYNSNGAYFITICTKNRKELLSEIIVGTGILDGPQNILTQYGEVADRQIKIMSNFYDNICVDKYVIMPNHIHILMQITDSQNGPSGTPVPTNAIVSKFIGTFKRFCNKQYGENVWQSRSYDHVIRGEQDYKEIWEYIDNNPLKWNEDRFYKKDR